jgi:hypothetical protein
MSLSAIVAICLLTASLRCVSASLSIYLLEALQTMLLRPRRDVLGMHAAEVQELFRSGDDVASR